MPGVLTMSLDIVALIDKTLREQTDKVNVIETLWQLFAVHVGIPPGGVQWIESRRCFFGGANLLFETIMRIMEPGVGEATEADLRRMDAIAKELQRFATDLMAGMA